MNESEFEKEFIDYIQHISEVKQWQYEKSIKTVEALWSNFKKILERHNQDKLQNPLSINEFNQVKKIITDLRTPYEAGQFLYGLNGVSEIELDLDEGRHVFLTVFDQKQVGAGDTVYQVVNQINKPAEIEGKKNRRFDITFLINGLPIIQIEAKETSHNVDEAFQQMKQYIDENQYRGIFSTLQILIGMTPNNIKYMANTTIDKFNTDFAFHWQRKENNEVVRNWKEFADSMLSIPMAHHMATNYMILDGTENKQMLKVMRPYQVYATERVIDGIKKIDFETGNNKIGYIWHTTGSGKTITSFKTAWLASRLPKVDKVVFVVDRIALTKQTDDEYKAYDPDGEVVDGKKDGIVQGTENTNDLNRKLKNKDNNIIVTSIQKLGTLVNRKNFQSPEKNILFIVDEAHRSTGGKNFKAIQKAFKRSAWVGYTGTPMFDETTTGMKTEEIFGELLHAYTIKEAIADKNVLGFKVDFETTIDELQMKEKYLPEFYKRSYPNWSDEKIKNKIENLTEEDIDDKVEPSFYDENPEHVHLVVEDIFKNWRNRSCDGKYNAILTTHVGGGKASVPMAMMYYDEFQKINEENKATGKQTLRVAISFSQNISNNETQLNTNRALHRAIIKYDAEFNTKFSLNDDAEGYTEDVRCRLNKTSRDKQYLDIVIVIDRLLTGFNAPELNTLYVDRTLKGASLIQAYSRTNRIADTKDKPWGRIINYRWPSQNEKLMNKALAIYANKNSAKLSIEEQRVKNKEAGILAKPFKEEFDTVKDIVTKLKIITDGFQNIPSGEKQREKMLDLLREYNTGITKLKQYDPKIMDGQDVGFDYDNPDDLLFALGMTPDEEVNLTTSLKYGLLEKISKEKSIPSYQLELKMTHVKDIKVDYDYLTQLIEQLLNYVHENNSQAVIETEDKINQLANILEDRGFAARIKNAVKAITEGIYKAITYPVLLEDSKQVIEKANNQSIDRYFLEFRLKWGITEVVKSDELRKLFYYHKSRQLDLDDTGILREIIAKASFNYKVLSNDEQIKSLNKIKYRNRLRDAIYELADEFVENGGGR